MEQRAQKIHNKNGHVTGIRKCEIARLNFRVIMVSLMIDQSVIDE